MISLCSFHGHKEYRRRRRRRARKCTCRKNCWPDDRCLHLLIYLYISAGPGISLKYLPTNSTSNIVPEEQHWAEMKATEHGAMQAGKLAKLILPRHRVREPAPHSFLEVNLRWPFVKSVLYKLYFWPPFLSAIRNNSVFTQ